MATADKLNKILETKEAIRQAIINKGVSISETDAFSSFATKINSIEAGGSSDTGVSLKDVASKTVTAIAASDLDGVESISPSLFSNCTALKSVELPQTLKSIASSAFENCTALTEVSLPENLETMESHIFDGCTALKSVTMGNKVSSLGSSSFSGCTSLKTAILSNSLTQIASQLFFECSALTSVNIPTSATRILDSAFYRCRSLTSIVLPESLTAIGGAAFQGCTALKSINIPERITRIENFVFASCVSIEKLVFPAGITYIGMNALQDMYQTTLDFSKHTSIPTITSSTFRYAGGSLRILVPTALYDNWIKANYWSSMASWIRGVDEDGNIVNSPS